MEAEVIMEEKEFEERCQSAIVLIEEKCRKLGYRYQLVELGPNRFIVGVETGFNRGFAMGAWRYNDGRVYWGNIIG